MVLAKQYEELVDEVNNIEKSSARLEFVSIDISQITASHVHKEEHTFNDVLNTALSIEAAHTNEELQKQIQKQQKQAPVQQHAQELIQKYIDSTHKPATETDQLAAAEKVMEQKPNIVQNVKNEVEELANALDKGTKPEATEQINTFKANKRDWEGLVLPNLSVGDQVAELERIVEGLNEHVFNEDQLAMVRRELEGLKSSIEVESDKNRGALEIERTFVKLRDQRLEEALGLIGESE